MLHTRTIDDPVTRVMSWIATRGVELRSWPEPTGRPEPPPDHPVLYLVESEAAAPPCRDLEDWVRLPIDIAELTARADRLVAWSRAQGASFVRVDEDDILRVGDSVVVLSQLEARLIRPLIEAMEMLVLRDDLITAVWPDGPPQDPRALDNRIKSLRARLADVPLELHTVHGRGLLLSRTAALEAVVR